MHNYRALVIGKHGQIASALASVATSSTIHYHFAGRAEADLTDRATLIQAFVRSNPAICINAAAYTAVDKAEEERELATAVNATGAVWLAQICKQRGIPLIHLSTDFVFNGKANTPYPTTAPLSPINVYGLTKAAGERGIQGQLSEHIIVRLAWIFGEAGSNFLQIMLRLGRDRRAINVVSDQFGPPSYADDIARGLDRIALRVLSDGTHTPWGIYHLTNFGSASRLEFAQEIYRLARLRGYPEVIVQPVTSNAFRAAAKRPQYSVLDCSTSQKAFGVVLRPWQDALKDCIGKIFASPLPVDWSTS